MKRARRPIAHVPGAAGMDDETLFKHLNARHKGDLGLSSGDMHYSPMYSAGLIGAHRAFHKRVHDIAVPNQHNHQHVEEN